MEPNAIDFIRIMNSFRVENKEQLTGSVTDIYTSLLVQISGIGTPLSPRWSTSLPSKKEVATRFQHGAEPS